MSKGGGQFQKEGESTKQKKYEIEDKSFSKQDRNSEAGEIDKVKGDSMTQEGRAKYRRGGIEEKFRWFRKKRVGE